MSERGSSVCELPSALSDGEALNERLAGRHPAVFLDYDGTLTPIVERPATRSFPRACERRCALARRCTGCVVSGRDTPVVQQLMGVDDLVDAGSHGFDIWSPDAGTLEHEASGAFEALKGTGIGVLVGDPDDPELACRPTAADYVLTSIKEVGRFRRTLAQ